MRLRIRDLYKDRTKPKVGEIIEYKEEQLKLISPDGDITTLIEEEVESSNPEIDSNPIVYAKQRWLVEVQPEDSFSRPFKTHRNLVFELGLQKKFRREGKEETVKQINITTDDIFKLEAFSEPFNFKDLFDDKFDWGAPMASKEDMDRYKFLL